MNKDEVKNVMVSKLFFTLVKKHANGSKVDFAKLTNLNHRWILDKCSGKDGLPAEKLFEILKRLGYNDLSEIDFSFDKKIANIKPNLVKKAKK